MFLIVNIKIKKIDKCESKLLSPSRNHLKYLKSRTVPTQNYLFYVKLNASFALNSNSAEVTTRCRRTA